MPTECERVGGQSMKSIRRQTNNLRISKQLILFLRVIRAVPLPLVLCFWAWDSHSHAQQLRDAFRGVQQAAVIVRTEQLGLAPFPQPGLMSSNGLGSGVLISNDRVITAAHLVESADKTTVEFSESEIINASVIGCSLSADIALLKLDHTPGNYVAAKMGDDVVQSLTILRSASSNHRGVVNHHELVAASLSSRFTTLTPDLIAISPQS